VATTPIAPAPARPCRSNGADDFLDRAMSLNDLITRLGDSSSSSPIMTILQQVREDMTKYGEMKQGRIPGGADGAGGTSFLAQGAPPTREQIQQMQDAAWMQSGATQADWIIRQFLHGLSTAPVTTDGQQVYADIAGDSAGPHLDKVIDDLQTYLKDIEVVVAPVHKLVDYRDPDGGVPGPKSAAGALILYVGPVLKTVDDAVSSVNAFLDPSAIPQLKNDLTGLAQGHDPGHPQSAAAMARARCR
jgi:hypothetical protein